MATADIYSQLADLSAERARIKQEIEEKIAALRAQLRQVEEQLDASAAALVASKKTPTEGNAQAQTSDDSRPVQLAKPAREAAIPDVPPRFRRLLAALRDNPGATRNKLALVIHGTQEAKKAGGISADLSNLKTLELADRDGAGGWRITQLGLRVIAQTTKETARKAG